MSNEDRGAFVSMGQCVDCHEDFGMYESEIAFYKSLQATNPEFQMPKRCKPCRDKKKAGKKYKGPRVDLNDIIAELEAMAEKSNTQCYYTYRDEELANELMDLVERLRLYVNQRRGA